MKPREKEELVIKRPTGGTLRLTVTIGKVLAASLALTGCGGAGSGLTVPTVAPAKVYTLGGFQPSTPVTAGHPVTVSFTVVLPSGKPLTQYKTGSGPHTGVHLIIVRDDLAYIIHQHPPVGPNGQLRQTVTFPAPGPYKVLVDVYPNIPGGQPNFQLFQTIDVTGNYRPQPLPAYNPNLVVDGYHFDMQSHPAVHAIQAQFLNVEVTGPHGQQAHIRPVVRRTRTRDLLPAGLARLLPHPHLRSQRAELRRAAGHSLLADLGRRRPHPESSRSACCYPRRERGGCSCR